MPPAHVSTRVGAVCCDTLQKAKLDGHPMFERISDEELDKDPAAQLLTQVGVLRRWALALHMRDMTCSRFKLCALCSGQRGGAEGGEGVWPDVAQRV